MSRFAASTAALLVLLLATVWILLAEHETTDDTSSLAEESGSRPASASNLDVEGEEESGGFEAPDPTSAWAFQYGPATVRIPTQGSIEIVVKPLPPHAPLIDLQFAEKL